MKLFDYAQFVGQSTIEELFLLANRLSGKVIQIINSTYVGGGVAEILSKMVPLLKELGLEVQWDVIEGGERFFQVTKKFHNAIHGRKESLSSEDFEIYLKTTQENMEKIDFVGDIIFIHDPQPVALIQKRKELPSKKWVWRCHIDASHPDEKVWNFLSSFIVQYDAAVFSTPDFVCPFPIQDYRSPFPIRQFLIPPSIDPLSNKNKELPQKTIDSVLEKYGIPRDKPIITQVSRFDYLKDPMGLIEAFKLVRKSIDSRLVLVGGPAADDPEGGKVLSEVKERAGDDPDIHILLLPPGSDIEINALQRASTIVVQKSIKEGFALTVSEALWKEKPVVASAVGGIPLQIRNEFTGLLSHGIEGTAYDIKRLLTNPQYALWLGKNGKEHVRRNFLLPRHLRDYLLLFLSLDHPGDIVYL